MRPRHWIAIVGLCAVALALLAAGAPNSKVPAGAEESFVKIYSLADLVAPTRVGHGTPAFRSLAEWSSPVDSDADERLARLENVLRLALPGESWEESSGKGAIASYPEKFSLVIRQTKAGHQAIEALLGQLRAEDDFEIELQVDTGGFTSVKDKEGTLKCMQMLGRPLAPEELTELQTHFGEQIRTILRVREGRAVVAHGQLSAFFPRFTAVASADRTSVELRVDYITDDIRPDGTFPYATEVMTIPAGRAFGLSGHCDGSSFVMLITPQIVRRSKS